MNKKYTCLVCGFDGLKESAYDKNEAPSYEVCPCCGFEPGFDSEYEAYRQTWIKNGAKWFIPDKKPGNWDLYKQLKNLE